MFWCSHSFVLLFLPLFPFLLFLLKSFPLGEIFMSPINISHIWIIHILILIDNKDFWTKACLFWMLVLNMYFFDFPIKNWLSWVGIDYLSRKISFSDNSTFIEDIFLKFLVLDFKGERSSSIDFWIYNDSFIFVVFAWKTFYKLITDDKSKACPCFVHWFWLIEFSKSFKQLLTSFFSHSNSSIWDLDLQNILIILKWLQIDQYTAFLKSEFHRISNQIYQNLLKSPWISPNELWCLWMDHGCNINFSNLCFEMKQFWNLFNLCSQIDLFITNGQFICKIHFSVIKNIINKV